MPPRRVPASGLAVATRVSSPTRRSWRFSIQPSTRGGTRPCLTIKIFSAEEQSMVDDELRRAHRGTARPPDPGPDRLVRRRGVVFIPPLDIGWRVMKKMEEPAKIGPRRRSTARNTTRKPRKQNSKRRSRPKLQAVVDAGTFVTELKKICTQARPSRYVKHSRAKAQSANAVFRVRD